VRHDLRFRRIFGRVSGRFRSRLMSCRRSIRRREEEPMRKRLLLIGGLAFAGVLTAGGVAYAVAGDPTPETRYVQVVEGDSAPAADEQTPGDQGSREDCPEKNGGTGDNNSGDNTTEQL
jgi:hypothetical protein